MNKKVLGLVASGALLGMGSQSAVALTYNIVLTADASATGTLEFVGSLATDGTFQTGASDVTGFDLTAVGTTWDFGELTFVGSSYQYTVVGSQLADNPGCFILQKPFRLQGTRFWYLICKKMPNRKV